MTADHVFGGRYRIVGEVGRGGMGVIFRGIDSVLDREVAIKVMSADFGETTDDQRARFFREARAAARLQHRNIVTVFEFAEQDGVPYIVMEFLKGRSLSARMHVDPPLTLEQKLDVMTELCNGLDFAHANGVVHRDVKPANVWLLDDGAVKLVDFGIAKISTSMTMHGDVMGSASYMSPEQIEGAPVTGRSDVFSAAVMLYELIARRRPFEGDSPTSTMMRIVHQPPPPIESIAPDLPRELMAAIAKGLAKNPADRYQSAAEFGAELQLIRMALPRDEATVLQSAAAETTSGSLLLKSVPLPAHDTGSGANTRPIGPGKTNPWLLASAGAAIVVVAVGYWLYTGRDSGQPPVGTTPPTTAATPATPDLHDFRVDSKPSGADVRVRGAVAGQTPVTVKLAAAGGAIRLELRGYQPRDVQVDAEGVAQGSGVYELQSTAAPPTQMVKVTLTGAYEFEVHDGDTGGVIRQASATHVFSWASGRRLRLFSKHHFLDKSITVKAQRGSAMQESAPELGYVYFKGNDSCLISHGDTSLNLYVKQDLPAMASGAHVFRFKCSDGMRDPIRVVIAPGQRREFEIK